MKIREMTELESAIMDLIDNCDATLTLDEFIDKVNPLYCKYLGHLFGPDHCAKPEHDFCPRCLNGVEELGFKRADNWISQDSTTWNYVKDEKCHK